MRVLRDPTPNYILVTIENGVCKSPRYNRTCCHWVTKPPKILPTSPLQVLNVRPFSALKVLLEGAHSQFSVRWFFYGQLAMLLMLRRFFGLTILQAVL